jgi:hypothetical protein
MSYAAAPALQSALFARLSGAAALAGVAIVDAQPVDPVPDTFVLIGPEEVSDASDKTGAGAEHRVTLSVVSRAAGFLAAKDIAAAICSAFEGPELALTEGRVVSIAFRRAVARRLDGGATRQIDLSFRIRIEI